MSYDDIVGLVKEIDNLVCGEGVTLFTWSLNEQDEFEDMLIQIYETIDYNIKDEYEYRDYLSGLIEECVYDQRKEILKNHKELWFTLFTKSELSCRYFTANDTDLFKRLAPLARQEFVIRLNKYNFIPEVLLQLYERNPMIELASHRVMSYVISWKKQLMERYFLVNKLESRYVLRMAYSNDRFTWNINRKQIKQLVSLLKRYFLPTTEEDVIVDILIGKKQGNIVWVKKTESLVHLFTQLTEKNLLLTQHWGMVLTRSLMFCSKQGNIITHKNINAILYRMRKKDIISIEQESINKILVRFSLIK